MGSRNWDRRPFAYQADGVNTIADMIRARWVVVGHCSKETGCGLWVKVNLPFLAKLLGPEATLWDRRPPCPRVGCLHRMSYYGVPQGGTVGVLRRADHPLR